MRLQIAIALSSASFFTVCAFSQTPAKEAEFASVKGKVVTAKDSGRLHKPGILRLALRPSGYVWQFVPEAGQSFTDSGSASCI